jgi:hypothetical protein
VPAALADERPGGVERQEVVADALEDRGRGGVAARGERAGGEQRRDEQRERQPAEPQARAETLA